MSMRARAVGLGVLVLVTSSWSVGRITPSSFDLPADLSSMIGSKAFHDWVITLDWSADEVLGIRSCEGSDDCNNGFAVTAVRIQPVGDARSLTPATVGTIGKGHGVVIGRIRQDPQGGKNQEKKYHIPVSKDYAYIVVQPAVSPHEPTYVVVRDMGSKGKILGKPFTFHDCKDDNTSDDKLPHAGFEPCNYVQHSKVSAAAASIAQAKARYRKTDSLSATTLRAARANLLKLLGNDLDAPAWFSCALGCCTAEDY
jgi:hypothetical protein